MYETLILPDARWKQGDLCWDMGIKVARKFHPLFIGLDEPVSATMSAVCNECGDEHVCTPFPSLHLVQSRGYRTGDSFTSKQLKVPM